MPITIDVEKDYLYQIGLEKGIKLERQKAEALIEEERRRAEAELELERRRVEELERQKAEAEIEAERRRAEAEKAEREKAEAEIEAERRKAEEAEAEKIATIIALYEQGLSIGMISQAFRTTEENIQGIISASPKEEIG